MLFLSILLRLFGASIFSVLGMLMLTTVFFPYFNYICYRIKAVADENSQGTEAFNCLRRHTSIVYLLNGIHHEVESFYPSVKHMLAQIIFYRKILENNKCALFSHTKNKSRHLRWEEKACWLCAAPPKPLVWPPMKSLHTSTAVKNHQQYLRNIWGLGAMRVKITPLRAGSERTRRNRSHEQADGLVRGPVYGVCIYFSLFLGHLNNDSQFSRQTTLTS